MVCGFINRYAENLQAEVPSAIELHATDTGARWWTRLDIGRPTSGRGRGAATLGPRDVEVDATAGELFLLLWNRRTAAGLHVRGDRAALDAWRHGAHRRSGRASPGAAQKLLGDLPSGQSPRVL